MKNKIINILKKELREVFRDKKSLAMMFIIPIMIPLIVLGMSALFESQMNSDNTVYNKIGFAYNLSSKEEELIKSLEIDKTLGTKEELEDSLKKGDIYLYITKEDNKYTLNYNMSSETGGYASNIANSFLESYKRLLQNEYLLNNNLNPDEVLNIFEISENDIASESFFANYIITYAFLFIIMAITVSATYPATDSTAGEKERGTLETLLTFPIKSRDIIIGKLLSVTISSIITGILSLILALISFKIANNMFTIYETLPITISISSIIFSIFVIIVYSFFISGLCIAIASLSKTFKEAQSALTPLTFISLFPGMIAFMVGIKSSILMSIIPFLNFTLVLNDVCVGIFNYNQIFLMFISTIIYISLIIWYIIKQYKSEKVLFSI